ncbi:biotin transporter BioY [Enterococcus hirae]|uniref:biotin transporter BioY n=1 Tax=Enterococcus hirae TaxID=1354 RepID=UPI0038796ADE
MYTNRRDITMMAMMMALLIITAKLVIPLPLFDYLSLQIITIYLIYPLLGTKYGLIVTFSYLILGLIGLPIFASGGGIFYIFKPSFGFLLSFATFPLIQATLSKLFWRRKWLPLKKILIINYSGLLYLYLIGLLYKRLILFFYLKETNVLYSVLAVSTLIDLSCDILLVFVASLLTYKLLPLIHKHKLANQLFIS